VNSEYLTAIDRRHVWHPFTPFAVWLDEDYQPTFIAEGNGATLTDSAGRQFIDGNSSIWVNLHGHRNRRINRAIINQLKKISHSSFLGLSNPIATILAKELVDFCTPKTGNADDFPSRVFFSDDGSTAIEAAVKVIIHHFALVGQSNRDTFVSLNKGYHGDTVGAMSVSQASAFHGYYKKLQFPSEATMAPYCYRCPYNKSRPLSVDARTTRICKFECISEFEKAVRNCGEKFAGVIIEPIVQGAAGMIMHPKGYLEAISKIAQDAGGKVVLDEVLTGFYRTGSPLAFHAESCKPDVICLAKGLTAGYLPLAATVVKEDLVRPFIGGPDKTFYHGHSYSGNQLGCAAALENLAILREPHFEKRLKSKIRVLEKLSRTLWNLENVGDVRQTGMILAVEIVENRESRNPFPPDMRVGWRISEHCKKFGLLTRPIGDVLLIMPPLSTTRSQLVNCVAILKSAIIDFMLTGLA
jgi:adenosylmethionine-8-amino-7-oxononanoate aminotransferase